jgi:NADPH:quinone reductase-like Zn-dependent oxidoreductase
MRAAVIEHLGQSPVAGELPDPVQKNEGQLLVHMHAAALNAIDVLIAAGNHPALKPVAGRGGRPGYRRREPRSS